MDAAEEVDDDHTGRGFLHFALAEEPVSQEQSQAGAGVGDQHEEGGMAELFDLVITDGSENTVVKRVVEEKHLGGFYENVGKGQDVVFQHPVDTAGQGCGYSMHEGTEHQVGKAAQDGADDTQGEVVDDHLKTARHLAVDEFIKFADDQTGERSQDHGGQEHGGSFYRYDGAQCYESAKDSAALAADHLTAGIGDQDGQQVVQYG